MVRLELYLTGEFDDHISYFNSLMVRLEFEYGYDRQAAFYNFNSLMVRLELYFIAY